MLKLKVIIMMMIKQKGEKTGELYYCLLFLRFNVYLKGIGLHFDGLFSQDILEWNF